MVKFLVRFLRFASVAGFGTDYFLLKIKILAKRERTTKFAIARNRCYLISVFFRQITLHIPFSSFCFGLSLFQAGQCLVHFGGSLVHFGGSLVRLRPSFVRFGHWLVYFGLCLFRLCLCLV